MVPSLVKSCCVKCGVCSSKETGGCSAGPGSSSNTLRLKSAHVLPDFGALAFLINLKQQTLRIWLRRDAGKKREILATHTGPRRRAASRMAAGSSKRRLAHSQPERKAISPRAFQQGLRKAARLGCRVLQQACAAGTIAGPVGAMFTLLFFLVLLGLLPTVGGTVPHDPVFPHRLDVPLARRSPTCRSLHAPGTFDDAAWRPDSPPPRARDPQYTGSVGKATFRQLRNERYAQDHFGCSLDARPLLLARYCASRTAAPH